MVKYLIVHCTHAGCYDYKTEQEDKKIHLMRRVTVNAPKVFMFDNKFQAVEFFHEYMNDIDCIDVRCKKGNDTIHIDDCTCGIVDTNDEGEPLMFYNRNHQIFMLELGPQTFTVSNDMRVGINNMNLTNSRIKKCLSLSREQRKTFIELGRVCQECEDKSRSRAKGGSAKGGASIFDCDEDDD
jgi:hypothetical protein